MRKHLFKRIFSTVSASVMVFASLGINNVLEGRTGSRYGSRSYKAEAAIYTQNNCPKHEFQWKTVRDSTCSEVGLKEYRCIYCGYSLTKQDIPLKSHTFNGSTFTITDYPTCTKTGIKVGECSKCGAVVEKVIIPAKGHTYGAWYPSKDPSCTEYGEKKHICSTCGYVESKADGAPLGHSLKDSVIKDPTCTQTGTGVSKCERCDKEIQYYTIPAKGHIYGTWYPSKNPSCTEYGEKKHICSTCGYVESESDAPPLGHSLKDSVIKDATCTEAGTGVSKCERCHQEIQTYSIPAKGHTFGSLNEKKPNCTESGENSRECTTCGYTEKEVIPPLGHQFIYYVKEEPTCSETGLKAEACERCKKEFSTEVIPKKDHCEYDKFDNAFMIFRCSGCNKAMPSTTETWYEYVKRSKVDLSALDEEKRLLFIQVYLSLKGVDRDKIAIALKMMSNGDMIDITDYEEFRDCMNKFSAFCGAANDINEIIPRFRYIGVLSNIIGCATLAADIYALSNTNNAGFIGKSERTTVMLNTLSDIVSLFPLYGTVFSEAITSIIVLVEDLNEGVLQGKANDIEVLLALEQFSPKDIRQRYNNDYTSLADPEFFIICRSYIRDTVKEYGTDALAEDALNSLIYYRLNADIKEATGMTIKDIQKNFKNIELGIKPTTSVVTTTPTITTTTTTATAKAVVPAPTPDQTTTTTKAAVKTTTTTTTATTTTTTTTTTISSSASTAPVVTTTESSSPALVQMIMLGDSITAKVYSDGNAYISGKGNMYDFEKSPFEAPENIENISFSGSIRSIGNNVFAEMSSISSLVIPKTVESIGEKAFDECAKLTDVGFEGSQEEWKDVSVDKSSQSVLSNIRFEGNLTVKKVEVLTGDSNCDGSISKADGMILARYIAGWEGITLDIDSADINKDGQISKADGMILARYIAGWEGYDQYFS